MKRGLGPLETTFFAYIQMRGMRTVRSGELLRPLSLTEWQERKILSRLCGAGLIARVRRGVYLIPPRLPVGGKWSPDEMLALNALMEDTKALYQICGPSAFSYHGFDEQIPLRVYAYNNRMFGDRTIGRVEITLIRVADTRLGDTDVLVRPDGLRLPYSSRVRTIVDAVYDWSRFGSLPRAFAWLRKDLASGRISSQALAESALRYGNTGTVRRIGALLEREGAEEDVLRRLEKSLRPTKGAIPLDPGCPKRGTLIRRWGVVENESV